MPAHSILPSVDKDVERFLIEQAKLCNLDVGNSKEVSLRLAQKEWENGTLTWEIDGKMILRLKRESITETVAVYTLEKIPIEREEPKKRILTASQGRILVMPGRGRRSRVL